MCGVLAGVFRQIPTSTVFDRLASLEYRGYDSFGICFFSHDIEQKADPFFIFHSLKSIDELRVASGPVGNSFSGSVLGHTRWATVGSVSIENSHPILSSCGDFSLVLNGTIANHHKILLQPAFAGIALHQDASDAVFAVELFSFLIQKYGSVFAAIQQFIVLTEGDFSIVCLHKKFPGTIFFIRKNMSICFRKFDEKLLISSDPASLYESESEKKFDFYFISANCFGAFSLSKKSVFDLSGVKPSDDSLFFSSASLERTQSKKHKHLSFMEQEIFEQDIGIELTVARFVSLLGSESQEQVSGNFRGLLSLLRKTKKIDFVASGTSFNAAKASVEVFSKLADFDVRTFFASDFSAFFSKKHTAKVVCFLSQSGETADVLSALRLARSYGVIAFSITNVEGSSLARESDFVFCTKAGLEVAVASTKAFSAQLATLYLLANALAFPDDSQALENAASRICHQAQRMKKELGDLHKKVRFLSRSLQGKTSKYFFLAKGYQVALAKEAALKFQELTYLLALGLPTGELKHGPLALIDIFSVAIFFSSQDESCYQKILIGVRETKLRGGIIVAFAFVGQDELESLADFIFFFVKVPRFLETLAMCAPAQLFAMEMAIALGNNVDKPRNLAKSVTVE